MTLSLNVPVPGRVRRALGELRPVLPDAREDFSLVCKRLDDDGYRAATRKRVRRVLEGQPAFEARTAGVETFEDPPNGVAPVVYLAIESPGLIALHERLCETIPPVPELEGDEYVPHVTIGRAPDPALVEKVRARSPEPVSWTVSHLDFWDPRYRESIGSVALPG
ncbi:MAG: 2'-5' RNA ligase family protein [Halobacteriaceae archaeon]